MDPTTAQHVREAFWTTMGLGAVFLLYFYFSHRDRDGGVTRWRRWRAWFAERYLERPLRSEPIGTGEPQQNADEHAVQGSLNVREPDDFDPPNTEELQTIGRIIRHKLSNPNATKESAIKAITGKSRGGGVVYQRYSDLYDLLMKDPPPPRYQPLNNQRQPV